MRWLATTAGVSGDDPQHDGSLRRAALWRDPHTASCAADLRAAHPTFALSRPPRLSSPSASSAPRRGQIPFMACEERFTGAWPVHQGRACSLVRDRRTDEAFGREVQKSRIRLSSTRHAGLSSALPPITAFKASPHPRIGETPRLRGPGILRSNLFNTPFCCSMKSASTSDPKSDNPNTNT